MTDDQLIAEALRRLPSRRLYVMAMAKHTQEQKARCPTAQAIREQQLWEGLCDAGR
jgi:Arc/MetJ family transcription regulator